MQALAPTVLGDAVHDAMSGRSETIRVFLDIRMEYVGCRIACFHIVDDGSGEHHVDREAFPKTRREVVESRSEQPSNRNPDAGFDRLIYVKLLFPV